MLRASWLPLSLILPLAALSGCAPTTTYRDSAFVPAVRPIAWDGQTPARAGTLSLAGSVAGATFRENFAPQVGDTAVLVPTWTAEGSAMMSVSSRVQIGVRASYASYAWSQQSAVGTMPIPGSPSSWGVGPQLRASFPLDPEGRFRLGLAGDVLYEQVPYAEWTLASGTACAQCVDGYSLVSTGNEQHMVYSVGLYPTFDVVPGGQYGHLIGLVSATNGFKNDGFSNQPPSGSTVQSVGPIVMVGGGYGVHFDWLRVSALLYKPLTGESSPVDYGPGFELTLGVDLELIARDD
jgi:hypothetical protein